MSRGDGTDPKFRILCQRCKSYMHTRMERCWDDALGIEIGILIRCTKCGNAAENFKEPFDD